MMTLKSEDLPEISTKRPRGIGRVRGRNSHCMPFLRFHAKGFFYFIKLVLATAKKKEETICLKQPKEETERK